MKTDCTGHDDIVRLRQRVIGFFAFLAACSAGCNDHCAPSRCNGTSLETCSLEGNDVGRRSVWKSKRCGVTCVSDTVSDSAFCAESATPIPECRQDGNICYHGAAATCRAGYLATSMACSGACVLAADTAFCAESTEPVPECQQDGLICYRGAIGICRASYIQSTKACGAGMTCAAAGVCGTTCVLSTTADPRCPPASGVEQLSAYCNGNSLIGCQCGYTVAHTDCGSDFCVAAGNDALCALLPTRDPRCGSPAPETSGFCDANMAWSCWNGYPVNKLACGTTGTCFVNAKGAAGCSYHAI